MCFRPIYFINLSKYKLSSILFHSIKLTRMKCILVFDLYKENVYSKMIENCMSVCILCLGTWLEQNHYDFA